MAWVTKNSEEEYKPYEAESREYTRRDKAANWWHYHKMLVLVLLMAAALGATMIKDILLQSQPDYEVGWVGRSELPEETAAALEAELAQYGVDLNGDGRVVVQLNQYTVNFVEEAAADADSEDQQVQSSYNDAYYQMAGVTKLSADLSDGKLYVLLLEDPEGFERVTDALQYLDGTLPEEGAADWQNMCYLWQDCPVLAGLELGEFTSYDEWMHSSQELLAGVYVARRGIWSEKDYDKFEGCAEFWAALTEGAAG